MNRRDFLATVPLTLAAEALGVPHVRASESVVRPSEAAAPAAPAPALSPSHDLDFASALRTAEAIRSKDVSSVELTRRIFERIDRYNPQLNAFAYQLREEALSQARNADDAQSRGELLGVFHGVPVHVKECFGVAGHPSTWGLVAFRDSKAAKNSEVVDRLLRAGAVLIGATNVPVALHDFGQSYNPIYGTTSNPWDVKRTPGGSSGGSAAALAAGLGYLSVGTDLAASIRVPASFCGIYGHKPTLDLVSSKGSLPGGSSRPPGFSTLLHVSGPMARSAADLLALLKVLGGPVGWDAKAWKWELPPARWQSLREFRVGYVLNDPIAPPTPEVEAVLEKAIQSLERAGAQLKPGWPPGVQSAELLDNYRFLLDAYAFSVTPPTEQIAVRAAFANSQKPQSTGGTNNWFVGASAALCSFAEWQRQNFRRLEFRSQWQAYFDQVDVFLSPVTFTTAFAHDHSEPQDRRTILTSSGAKPYFDVPNWAAPATLIGCPATVAPVGQTKSGLPVGIQIMGPYWEDATPITFAGLLAEELGGFTAPPGYET
jgi:amidase